MRLVRKQFNGVFFHDIELQVRLVYHRAGNARQLRHLDPVTPVRGAGFDGIKEDDLVVVFYRVQVRVLHCIHDFRQGRKFEVMGGEQGKSPDVVCQVSGAGPGQGQPVVSAGAAADLVDQHQAPVGGVVQDACGLHHFRHEGGFPRGDVIDRADTGEDAVDGADYGALRRDETADMRQQRDERSLAHVGGFAAHVRPGNQQHPDGLVQADVVGEKGIVLQTFDNRVTPGADMQPGGVGELGPAVIQRVGPLGKTGQHVGLAQRCGGGLQGREVGADTVKDLLIQYFFPRQRAFFCAQHLVFKIL